MDSHDVNTAVHGRTQAVLPHTEGGKLKAETLDDYKHVTTKNCSSYDTFPPSLRPGDLAGKLPVLEVPYSYLPANYAQR